MRFRSVEEPLDCHHLTRPEAARLHADRPRLDGEESCAAASLSDGRGDEAPLLIPVERHAEVALGVQDIRFTTSSIGTVFLYSNKYLEDGYAEFLAEEQDVGAVMNP